MGGNGQGGQKFSRTLTKGDFMEGDVSPSTTEWIRLGEDVVNPQQSVRFGYGDAEHPDNQGYLYVLLKNASSGVEVDGKVRLAQVNALETRKIVVYEERTEVLSGSTSDKSKKIALPEQAQFPRVGEDSRLILEILMDAEDEDISKADSTILIPVSVYY